MFTLTGEAVGLFDVSVLFTTLTPLRNSRDSDSRDLLNPTKGTRTFMCKLEHNCCYLGYIVL